MEKHIYKTRFFLKKRIILDTFGVAMARNGLILWENEATGSRKVFKYLPGLRDTIKKSKMPAEVQQSQNTVFYRIFILWDPSLLSAYAGLYISKL